MNSRPAVDRDGAASLFQRYVDAWLTRDPAALMACVTDDIEVIESYGSTYRGRAEVRRWFERWHGEPENGRVKRWDVSAVVWDEESATAVTVWDFACLYRGKDGGFAGASLVTFAGTRIDSIREYRSDSPA